MTDAVASQKTLPTSRRAGRWVTRGLAIAVAIGLFVAAPTQTLPDRERSGPLVDDPLLGPATGDAGTSGDEGRGLGFWTSTGPEGGWVNGVASDPSAPATVYAGTLNGLFKSVDTGATWSRVRGTEPNTLPEEFGWSVAVDPGGRVYVGTFSSGLFWSDDGGDNWFAGAGSEDVRRIVAIVIDPTPPYSTVYIAGSGTASVSRSDDAGRTWVAVPGTAPNALPGGNVSDLAISGTTLYAGHNFQGVWRTDDGGANWFAAAGIAPDQLPSARILAMAMGSTGRLYVATGQGDGVFWTEDGGDSWFSGNGAPPNELPLGDLTPDWARTLTVDDTETVILGGRDDGFRGTNGGQSWSLLNIPVDTFQFQGLASDAAVSGRVWGATDTGVLRSDDSGVTWVRQISGLRSFRSQRIKLVPGAPESIYMCSDAGVARSTDAGSSWLDYSEELETRDVWDIAVGRDPAPESPVWVYAASPNWTEGIARRGEDDPSWTQPTLDPEQFGVLQWPVSLAVDPLDAEHVFQATVGYPALAAYFGYYYGPGGVLESTDGGATWTNVFTPSTTPWPDDDGILIHQMQSIGIDPENPERIYSGALWLTVGGASGWNVVRSTDGGATWQEVLVVEDEGLGFPYVKFDPGDAVDLAQGRVSAVYVHSSPDHLRRSLDGGETWTDLSPLPGRMQGLVAEPGVGGTLYAIFSDETVRVTRDRCESWETLPMEGFDDYAFFGLQVTPTVPRLLHAGSGGGIYSFEMLGAQTYTPEDSSNPGSFPATVSFDNVVAEGEITLTTRTTGPALPGGYTFAAPPLYYELTSTALTVGEIEVCIDYDAAGLTWPPAEMKLFRYDDENEVWIEVAASVDTDNEQICGFMDTLSLFVVVEPAAAPGGDGVWFTTSPDGGWVYMTAYDPTTPETMYAGTVNGVFKTINGGATWFRLDDDVLPALVWSVAVGGDGRVYAGGQIGGFFWSDDGGATWNAGDGGISDLRNIEFITVDPNSPFSTIHIGGFANSTPGVRIFRSDDGGQSWSPGNGTAPNALPDFFFTEGIVNDGTTLFASDAGDGVWRSTDNGANWFAANGVPPNDLPSTAIGPIAIGSGTLYAATRDGNGVYATDDGGDTWFAANGTPPDDLPGTAILGSFTAATANPGAGEVSMSQSATAGDLVTIAVNVTDTSDVFGASFDLVYDAGAATFVSWAPGSLLEQGGNATDYIVSDSAGTLVVGASRLGAVPGADAVGTVPLVFLTFRVTQVGASVMAFSNQNLFDSQSPPQPIPGISWSSGNLAGTQTGDPLRVWSLAASGAGDLYLGFADGIYKGAGGGASWTQLALPGVPTPTRGIATDPNDSDAVTASRAVGVIQSQDAGASWGIRNSGLRAWRATNIRSDSGAPAVTYATGNSGAGRTLDSAASWTYFDDGLVDPDLWDLAVFPSEPPNELAVIYTVSPYTDAGLARRNEDEVTWSYPTLDPFVFGIYGPELTAVEVDPANSNRVIVGHVGYPAFSGFGEPLGGLFLSSDGGQTWTSIYEPPDLQEPDPNSIQVYQVNDIAVDTLDSDRIYATSLWVDYSGEFGWHLIHSTDGGATWQETLVGTGLEFFYISLDPTDSVDLGGGDIASRAYLFERSPGMLQRSDDGGSSWTEITNLPDAPTGLAPDPTTVGAVYGLFRDEVVRLSRDRGETWEALPMAGFDTEAFISLEVAATSPPTIHASGNSGVYTYRMPGQQTYEPEDTSTPGSTPVSVTYEQVVAPGHVVLTTTTDGPTLPTGTTFGDPPVFYEVSSSVIYFGEIEICVDYNPSGLNWPPESLQLLEFEDGVWIDVTTSVDTESEVICGVVDSTSIFTVVQPASLPSIGIPIRWCGVAGAPSIDDPSVVGESTVNGMLLQRQTRATDNIFLPQAGLIFRAGTTTSQPSFPILVDPNTSIGQPGDVFVDTTNGDYTEFFELIQACREAWAAGDPSVVGITAVNVRRFVDAAGQPTNLLGMGGRADAGNCSEQMVAGRVVVVDETFLVDDMLEKVLSHELGHGVSLRHGDGVDNDANGVLDDEDDPLDGPNLMQYEIDGIILTPAQAGQGRNHSLACIPDVTLAGETAGSQGSDPLADVPGAGWVDLIDIGMYVDGETGTTGVYNGTADTYPDDGDVQYYNYVDLDDDPITGGQPGALGFPTNLTGIELILSTTVTLSQGDRETTTEVWVWDGAGYQQQLDPAITAEAKPARVGLFQDLSGPLAPSSDPAISETVIVTLPTAILPPISATPTVNAQAIDVASGTTDEGVAEIDFTPPVFPEATVTPATAGPGMTVTVNATGLPASSPVEVRLGSNLVATGSTDADGNATVPFTVPAGTAGGERLVTIGVSTESEAVSAVATLVVPTAPFFDTPPTPVGGAAYELLTGTRVEITVQASDLDVDDVVTLGVVGMPAGGTFTSEPGNPAVGTFSWTPTPEQSGIVGVTFTATDATGNTAPPRSISIASGTTFEATIDIKPKRYPNHVHPSSRRELPLALLGRADFDVHRVDITTLRFGPAQVAPIHVNPPRDSNRDGYDDKIMLFIPADTGIVCGDTQATLTGEYFDGTRFSGTDEIVTIGCSYTSNTGEKVTTTAEPDVFGDND